VALNECWYSQLSSTLTPSAGGGGKGSPSSPGKKKEFKELVQKEFFLSSYFPPTADQSVTLRV